MQFPTRCWFVRSVSVYTELSARSTREYRRTKVYNYPVRAVRPPVRQSALRLIYDARLWRTRTIRGVEGAVDWGGEGSKCFVQNHISYRLVCGAYICIVYIRMLCVYAFTARTSRRLDEMCIIRWRRTFYCNFCIGNVRAGYVWFALLGIYMMIVCKRFKRLNNPLVYIYSVCQANLNL